MSYEPLHHKYRPQTFADLVGQEPIATTLTNAIRTSKIAPAYLFTGPRGTGKTSSARIMAKSLNCIKSDKPTEQPCGVCLVCKGIANGSALDVIEIDAASNTGVENIRELIERAQFAPVQCRYKVYVIDECLTGDSLVQTSEGLIRIDDPNIKGKKVISYNESSRAWEFKKVVRWLDQGERQTLVIKTTNREIRCTSNHLIRTEQGWIAAKDVKEGTRILSPVNVDAALSFTNLGRMDAPGDLLQDTSSKAMHTGKNPTTCSISWNRLKPFDPSALVSVVKSLMSPPFYKKKAKELKAFSPTGKNIHTKKHTEVGTFVQKSLFPMLRFWNQKHLGLSTELCLEIAPSLTQTNTADSLDWLGHTEKSSKNGWNTKPIAFPLYDQSYELHQIRDTEIYQSVATHPVIPNSKMFLTSLNRMGTKKSSLWTGSIELPQKDLLGGSWMTVHSAAVQKEVHRFSFIQKDTLLKKIKSLPVGLQQSVIQQKQSFIQGLTKARRTITHIWAQTHLEPGCQTSNSIQSHQWITSLEMVESVKVDGLARVYDIEVENNHNFVANGLLVHNCHMLSSAAFNALLKTLEEPPAQVVFILATTDPQRVLPTIISRCQRFDFRRIAIDAMVKHLQKIAFKENINITPESMQLVAQVAQGGLRDAESLLDQLSLLPCQVTVEQVWDLVGSCSEPDLIMLLQAIAQNNPEAILDCAHTIMDRGREPLAVLQNLAGFYRDLLIAKTAPHRNDLVALTPPTWMELCEQAKSWDTVTILAGQQHLAKSEVQIKNTTQPRLWLEVTLLGLMPSANSEQRTVLSVKPVQSISQHSKPRLEPITAKQPTAHHDSIPSEAEDVKETQTKSPSPTTSVAEDRSEPRHATSQPAETDAHPSNLEQVWQLFLSHLQPYSTQTLLRQHGCLLTFEEQQALIGIRSEALLKMAKPGLTNMEAAFQAAFHHQVKVSLEVALPAQKSQATDGNSFTKTKIQPPTNVTDVTPGVVTKPAATPSPEAMEQPQSPVTPSDKATLSADSEENEVAIAAQRLADFFRGEVVKFNLDPTFSDSENQNTLPPVTTPALEWDDADLSITEAEIDF